MFEYKKDVFANETKNFGPIPTFDIDGDGWLEMIVTNHEEGTLEIFKMSEA